LVGGAVKLFISISKEEFPLGVLMMEAGAAIAWAIFSRL
jgi:hypothetical protein